MTRRRNGGPRLQQQQEQVRMALSEMELSSRLGLRCTLRRWHVYTVTERRQRGQEACDISVSVSRPKLKSADGKQGPAVVPPSPPLPLRVPPPPPPPPPPQPQTFRMDADDGEGDDMVQAESEFFPDYEVTAPFSSQQVGMQSTGTDDPESRGSSGVFWDPWCTYHPLVAQILSVHCQKDRTRYETA